MRVLHFRAQPVVKMALNQVCRSLAFRSGFSPCRGARCNVRVRLRLLFPKLVLIWFVLSQNSAVSVAGALAPPEIPVEISGYRTLRVRDGTPVRELQVDIRRLAPLNSAPVQQITMSIFQGETVSRFESVLKAEPGCAWIRMSREKETGSGRVILSECIISRKANGLERESYPLFSLLYVLRGLSVQEKGVERITAVLPGGFLLGFGVRVAGPERVRVPAGVFHCRKVVLSPRIEQLVSFRLPLLKRLIQPVIPKVFFWFDVRHPYVMVKESSIAGIPPNDERVVDELIRVSNAPDGGTLP